MTAMAASLTIQKRDRFFTLAAFVALGLAFTIASFLENDRRGLLKWDRPTAFAAGELQLPVRYPVTYLGFGDRNRQGSGRTVRMNEGGARRAIPRRIASANDLNSPFNVSDSSPPISTSDLARPNSSSGDLLSEQLSLEPARPNRTPFTSSGFGGGSLPPGFVVVAPGSGGTPNPPPVVPAVPEPAAWLLMILGIGLLASLIRREHRINPATRERTDLPVELA